jgi:hypothetical protein
MGGHRNPLDRGTRPLSTPQPRTGPRAEPALRMAPWCRPLRIEPRDASRLRRVIVEPAPRPRAGPCTHRRAATGARGHCYKLASPTLLAKSESAMETAIGVRLRKRGGLIDAPGRWLYGQGQYPEAERAWSCRSGLPYSPRSWPVRGAAPRRPSSAVAAPLRRAREKDFRKSWQAACAATGLSG